MFDEPPVSLGAVVEQICDRIGVQEVRRDRRLDRRSVARPAPTRRMATRAMCDRVQRDVPEGGDVVLVSGEELGFVSALEQRAYAAVAVVEPAHVCLLKELHANGEVRLPRSDQRVEMVVHQAIRCQAPAMLDHGPSRAARSASAGPGRRGRSTACRLLAASRGTQRPRTGSAADVASHDGTVQPCPVSVTSGQGTATGGQEPRRSTATRFLTPLAPQSSARLAAFSSGSGGGPSPKRAGSKRAASGWAPVAIRSATSRPQRQPLTLPTPL